LSDYLIKPIKQSELLDAILNALACSRELVLQAEPKPIAAAPAHRLHILVVEDNPVNQRLIARLLEKRGHAVTTANNGREALAVLYPPPGGNGAHPRVDVVLMDLQMPEMGGLEATAAIRQRERSSGEHIPIIAVTAHAMPGDRERCLQAGMDGYLSKPVQAAELIRVIADVLEVENPVATSGDPAEVDVAFDRQAALTRLEGDADLLREMAGLFLGDYPRQIAALREAIEHQDADAIQRTAHTLKGALSSLGARPAAAAALALEDVGRARNHEQAPRAFEELMAALNQLLPYLLELHAVALTDR
jgi:CheY-like chemotaxis protein